MVAKGTELLAAKIREIATENGVPIVEAPPLARALYKSVEIGREVPAALYVTVAQVLTYVYQLRAARERGATPPPPPIQQCQLDYHGQHHRQRTIPVSAH